MLLRADDSPRVLYLTYDGLSDALGGSQIVPYLLGLARSYRITVISFEKPERIRESGEELRTLLASAGVRWHRLRYTKSPAVASTVFDLLRMRYLAARLHRDERFDIVHCRSYIAALTGLELRRRFGIRFVFDMRGFWPDEKVEGGSWNLSRATYRRVYRYFKAKEGELVAAADVIVSLTHAGKDEIRRWAAHKGRSSPIVVIPCSADFDHFDVPSRDQARAAREVLGLRADALVAVYLGSLGTWYALDEVLDFFRVLKTEHPHSQLAFITNHPAREIHGKAHARALDPADVVVTPGRRGEIPFFLAAADLGLMFIHPFPSKRASSPTKLGEYLAVGLPVIANAGVGDVDRTLRQVGGGVTLAGFNRAEYEKALLQLSRLLAADRRAIRARAESLFSLQSAIQLYMKTYEMALARHDHAGQEKEFA